MLALLLAFALLGTAWSLVAAGTPGAWPAALGPARSPTAAGAVSAPVTVPILIYHVFTPSAISPDAADYQIATATFDAQLQLLRVRGWQTITAGQLGALLALGQQPRPHTFVITVDDGMRDGWAEALPVLRRHGFVATFFVIAGRMGTPGYLSWDEVRGLRDAGMEIGSHTFSHVTLGEAPAEQARTEVRDAQEAIERELGEPPLTFAYPGGSYNETAVQAVREAGLLAAFTTERGHTFSWSDRLTIPRLNVGGNWSPQLLYRYVRSGA